MRATARHIAAAALLMGMLGAHANETWQPVPMSEFMAAKQASDALYAGLTDFRMTVLMSSFRSWDDAAPHQRVNASLTRAGDRFRSDVGGMVTIQDDRIRVVYDADDRAVMVVDPVELNNAWALGAVDHVLKGVASCFKQSMAGATEYKLVFGQGAVYDHTIVRYDGQGWLRSTSTVWRQAIAEDPNIRVSASYRPRLDVEYGIPVARVPATDLPDPWRFVQETDAGLVAIGPWKGAEIIDSRYRP